MTVNGFINPKTDLPFDRLASTRHPQIKWASTMDLPSSESEEIKNLIEESVEFIKQQLLPFRMESADIYVVPSDDSLGVYCADGESIPILWAKNESVGRNIWFLAHELTEATIRSHLGPFVPRWLYESLAQLAGWRTCSRIKPGSELEGLKYYEAKQTKDLPEEELLNWIAPRIVLDDPTPEEVEQAIQETKDFAQGEHKSEREGNFYALAHKFSLARVPEDLSIGWALANTIDGASKSYFDTIQSLKQS